MIDSITREGFLNARHCPICGKEFYPTAEWVYKTERHVFCSWKCLRVGKTKRLTKEPTRACLKVERLDLKGNVLNTFSSRNEAAAFIGKSVQWITKLCTGKAKQKDFIWRYKENELP